MKILNGNAMRGRDFVVQKYFYQLLKNNFFSLTMHVGSERMIGIRCFQSEIQKSIPLVK